MEEFLGEILCVCEETSSTGGYSSFENFSKFNFVSLENLLLNLIVLSIDLVKESEIVEVK